MIAHQDFVEIASKFFGVGRDSDGFDVLRQGLKLRHSNIASTLALANEFDARHLHFECLELLESIPFDEVNAEALCLKGFCALRIGRADLAEQAFHSSLRQEPHRSDALVGLATICWGRCQDADARAYAKQALRADPSNAKATTFVAGLAMHDGDLKGFEDGFARGRQCKTIDPVLEHSYATALLRRGVWDQGWRGYKNRESYVAPHVFRNHKVPERLADCAGKRVCLFIEQGFGDIIQFFRYVEALQNIGADVHVRCHQRLHRLLSTSPFAVSFLDSVKNASTFDYVMPLFDIPCMLDWSSQQHFGTTPYLAAEPKRVAKWRKQMTGPGPKIAFAWQGNPNTAVDIGRSLSVEVVKAFVSKTNATFFSIQKGAAEQGMQDSAPPENLCFLDGMDDGSDAFVDTAAVMQNADLVLTTDTSVAHLAGALGVTTAIMLQARADWRWGINGPATLWYPNVTLLRQAAYGDWTGVTAEATNLIHDLQPRAAKT